ncbi:TlpA family protein disulfide reductase [Chitinophaga ginsengisegetis]|uniref:TlpA family protein disulfide reductase n=1 Tax=Chitinophaga ginsengisegetis TaxID=393003 RepID=UPI000DBFEE25|nr:hypothetical protein [Chitinophaga ginsengisegetis]MDR6567447.1 thiol-disulfide isomerase/thioredoxin [Chitinophaga ginsengisegetis]MDR6647178.1 thiol-disulfide isomerase/thioredoxin [Chitinophaga ginsengisegetis]MDR6653527.1 thiol-disulfide isomerase/thioredoxin [Chitinophaga ginsengisegetis]
MKHRKIFYFFGWTLFGLIIYFSIGSYIEYSYENRIYNLTLRKPFVTGLEKKLIPSFDIFLVDSTTHINTGEIPEGKPFILLYFSPYCPYCQEQIREIVVAEKELKDIKFYIFTQFSFSEMKDFYYRNRLDTSPEILVGIDKDYFFSAYYKAYSVPFVAVYGRDRRLINAFKGKISIGQIKTIVKE